MQRQLFCVHKVRGGDGQLLKLRTFLSAKKELVVNRFGDNGQIYVHFYDSGKTEKHRISLTMEEFTRMCDLKDELMNFGRLIQDSASLPNSYKPRRCIEYHDGRLLIRRSEQMPSVLDVDKRKVQVRSIIPVRDYTDLQPVYEDSFAHSANQLGYGQMPSHQYDFDTGMSHWQHTEIPASNYMQLQPVYDNSVNQLYNGQQYANPALIAGRDEFLSTYSPERPLGLCSPKQDVLSSAFYPQLPIGDNLPADLDGISPFKPTINQSPISREIVEAQVSQNLKRIRKQCERGEVYSPVTETITPYKRQRTEYI